MIKLEEWVQNFNKDSGMECIEHNQILTGKVNAVKSKVTLVIKLTYQQYNNIKKLKGNKCGLAQFEVIDDNKVKIEAECTNDMDRIFNIINTSEEGV